MKTILFFLLMCISVSNLNAKQNYCDSLKQRLESIQNDSKKNNISRDSLQIQLLYKLALYYQESRPDSSIFYARELLQVAQTTENVKQQDNALFSIAYGF